MTSAPTSRRFAPALSFGLAVAAALPLAGCLPPVPPESATFVRACEGAPRVEHLQTRPARRLFFGFTRIWVGLDQMPLPLPEQPCFGCIDALITHGYDAVEYYRSDEEGFGLADEANVARHQLAAAGDPRCAWSDRLWRRYRSWLRERVPAGQCVTLETGPRQADIAVEETHRYLGDLVSEQGMRLVDRSDGALLATSVTYRQSRGDYVGVTCGGELHDSGRRLLNQMLAAGPSVGAR